MQFQGHSKAYLSLCLASEALKAYGGVNVQIRAFLTWALGRGERPVSQAGRFNPRGSAPTVPLG
jgi:hypothetical protein